MRVTLIGIAGILIASTLTGGMVGCLGDDQPGINQTDNETVTTTISTNPSSLPSSQDTITVTGVHVSVSKSVYFHGSAALPDGTILLSQLYEDNKPLPWWPAGQPITVEGGKWEISVPLGTNGAPSDLPPDPGYHFTVWSRDNALIKGTLYLYPGIPPVISDTSISTQPSQK